MVDGVHINWPSTHHKHRQDGKVDIYRASRMTSMQVTTYFEEAKAYALGHPGFGHLDVRHEGMKGSFDGTLNLYVHARDYRAITGRAFKREFGIENMVIVGGQDAYLAADVLRENNVSVLLSSVHALPRFAEDDVTYRLSSLSLSLMRECCLVLWLTGACQDEYP